MEDIRIERICAIALGKVFGYEPLYVTGLISRLGSAAAIFDLSTEEIDGLLGPGSKYRGMVSAQVLREAEAELEELERRGWGYVASTEAAFPAALKECQDCPAGLYYRASSPPEEFFADGPAIAVVGTRDISPYGREWTRKIVDACSQAPARPAIISGLAFGVDINAHLSALEKGLRTIAVLPCGIDGIYPAAHRQIAERIIGSKGSALVTDYPLRTSPVAFTFIRRNRIIAGLAQSTLLIESKAKGGGLITCRLADGYGRQVFALPGRVDDIRSAGCNTLIREGVAEAVTGLSGIGEQLGLGRYRLRKKEDLISRLNTCYSGRLDTIGLNQMLRIAELIREERGIDLEELCIRSGQPYNEVARTATMLESDGFICLDLMGRCTINERKS